MIANLKRYAMRRINLKPMAQQTAVEWLISQVNSEQYQIAFGQTYISIDLIEQAKQMEKEQIVDAHYQGYRNDIGTTDISEQYYNETYKKD